VDVNKLAGVWFHLHEEDEGDRTVYRNESYEFPRSRAPRRSLVLNPDGTASLGGPGPADETLASQARWEVSGTTLTLDSPRGQEQWEIETLDDDRLVLRRRADREGRDG
jgi:hypothetical protein